MAVESRVRQQEGVDFASDISTSRYEGSEVSLGRAGRVLISPDRPMPEFDSPHAKAYNAVSRVDSSRSVIALICEPNIPPRFDAMSRLRGFHLPGLLKVQDWGLVTWNKEGGRKFVVVIDRPGGQRVFTDLTRESKPLSEDIIIHGFMQPAMQVLREMQQRNVSHRSIRPTNLFYSDSSSKTIVLGESVTTPPAYDQPALFEPNESAMCLPIGRGMGSISSDLYSLGVTALFLLLGHNPAMGMSESDLIARKIEAGSYSTLVGMARLPLGMMEALRGLLNDDPRDRWTVNELDMWLAGRRLSPKQPRMPPHSSRPFEFMGKEFYSVRALAASFAENYEQAVSVVRSKNLDAWIRRGVGDEKCANALQAAVTSTASYISGRCGEDRLVARACIALDPSAPIRYRGVGIAVTGLGSALSASMDNPDMRQVIADIVSARLPNQWVAAQESPNGEDLRISQSIEVIPPLTDATKLGGGIERILYELNPTEVCHSALLTGNFVTEIGSLIPVLDEIARRTDRPELVLDRHLLAFLAARLRRINEDIFQAVGSTSPEARSLAILRLLSGVQEQAVSPPAPHLAQWVLSLLGTVTASFHNEKRRVRVQEKLGRAAKTGRLIEILRVIDDNAERNADNREFTRAVNEYRKLHRDSEGFDQFMVIRNEDARILGEQIAAAFGGITVSISMAILLLIWFT
ncbi:MAG: hypothetical protein QM523_05580 [Candidatus Pacebacteria bacterium]|nr:hypothetical protein [Candidatus Paceibacterota bacterium]